MSGALLVIAVAVLAAEPAPPDDARVAVVIGSNLGLDGEEPLEFAEDDARRVAQLLVDAGGVSKDRVLLVTGGDAGAARRALAQARGRLEELKGRAATTLLLYVSAHADGEALHLGGTTLPLDELRADVTETPAGLRLVIIDACRTAPRVRLKGGRPGPPVAISLARPAEVSGTVWLMAAGEGEAAQELASLGGSLFTHHLLLGLRGPADVDGDGQVSLAEAYTWAYLHTVGAASRSSAGPQRPAFELSVRGFGDWAFTRPERFGATLQLSEGWGGRVTITDEGGALVGELSKPAGASLRVALRPGWYRVLVPVAGLVRAADVNLAWGGTRELDASELTPVPLERARRRGGDPIVLRPWRLGAAAGASTGLGAGQPVWPVFGVQAQRVLEVGFLRARLEAGWTRFRAQALTVEQGSAGGAFGAGLQAPVWRLLVGGGLEAQALVLWQRLVRDDAEVARRVFGVEEPARAGFVVGGAAFGVASLPLGDRAAVALEVSAGLVRVPTDAGPVLSPRVTGSLSVSFSL